MQDIPPENEVEPQQPATPVYEPPSVTLLGSVEDLTKGGVGVGDDAGFTGFSVP
jgi:hypothetical protein